MTAEIFRIREQALEYEFFHKIDEELLRQLRRTMEIAKRRQALAEATGIRDEAVLDELVSLDISSETIFALSLFPLVWVAWADGRIDQRQRQAILEAAHSTGHERDTASHRLIEQWLDHKPDAKLIHAWKDYIQFISRSVGTEARLSLKQDVVGRARQVAEAVSSVYGFHDAEAVQDPILMEIENAFDITNAKSIPDYTQSPTKRWEA